MSRQAHDPLVSLLRGEIPALRCEAAGLIAPSQELPKLLLPGSFNPVHAGHWGLADAAGRLTALTAQFELSVTNVDKAPLPIDELQRRLRQFSGRAAVWLTRAATFAEKAGLFSGATFVVGADTAVRLLAPRYYQGSEKLMLESLAEVKNQGCSFLVAGRTDSSGRYVGLEDISVPASLQDLFAPIPRHEFHVCISSTEIRKGDPPVANGTRND